MKVTNITANGYIGIGLSCRTVSVEDEWTHVVAFGKEYGHHYCKVRDNTVVVTIPTYEFQDTQEAIELRELLDKWRTRGEEGCRKADCVEYQDEWSVWDFLQNRVVAREEVVEAPVDQCHFEQHYIRSPKTSLIVS